MPSHVSPIKLPTELLLYGPKLQNPNKNFRYKGGFFSDKDYWRNYLKSGCTEEDIAKYFSQGCEGNPFFTLGETISLWLGM